jgi:hypothetical protein
MKGTPPWTERWTAWHAAFLLGLISLIYRNGLRSIYFGAEEEDYGNLGLILGTLQSGFTYIETQHMPLFTSLAAAVTAITADAEAGGEVVALVSGSLAVATLTWIGWRWLHPATGLLAGLFFTFHPDAALHAATPLRISTFVFLCLAGIALVGERRPVRGGLLLSLAFLTRFEVAFTLLPALVLLTSVRRTRGNAIGTGLLATAVGGWALYYRSVEGTYRFWGDVVTRTTDGAASMLHPGTVWGVMTGMLPEHLGYLLAIAVPFGAVAIARSHGKHQEHRRWLLLCGASVVGFFCLTILLSSYAPDHNLFWKWSVSSLPFLLLAGSQAFVLLGSAVWSRLRETDALRPSHLTPLALTLALGLGSVAADYVDVTRSQLKRSAQWYGTQVHLMGWIEAEYPPDVILVADNIPATWLSRIENDRHVIRWSAEPTEHPPSLDERPSWVPSGLSRSEFGSWLIEKQVSLVIVFAENNRGSLTKAPWLADLIPQTLGAAQLQPIAREDGYGFIAWQVRGIGAPEHPSELPPSLAGGVDVVMQ